MTLALQPDLNIVDAFYAMEKNGPVAGNDIDGGVRIYGTDAYEVDCYGAALIGLKKKQVKYLSLLENDCNYIDLDSTLISKYSFHAEYPGKWLSVNNSIGLWIQRRGMGLANTGDRIHIAKNPFRFVIAIFRPFLIKMFGLSRLKNMKNHVEGE